MTYDELRKKYNYEVWKKDEPMMAFLELEDAIEYANQNECDLIMDIQRNDEEYEKCDFCGEWYPIEELNIDTYCERCQRAILDHGFQVDHRKKTSRFEED